MFRARNSGSTNKVEGAIFGKKYTDRATAASVRYRTLSQEQSAELAGEAGVAIEKLR